MNLGFIGTGSIASFVVTAIAPHDHQITISRRSTAHSARLAEQFTSVSVAENQAVVDRSDVVFVGLLAAQAPAILSDLQFRAGQRVISFIAELSLDEIAAMVAPAAAVAIMIPFPAIAQGGSPILTLGDPSLVRTLFSPDNTVFALQTADEMQAYLCAQAVVSPALLLVATAADWIAAQGIDAVASEAFLRVLVGSNLQANDCRATLNALATPGGYNLRLRQTMERAQVEATLFTGLDALKG